MTGTAAMNGPTSLWSAHPLWPGGAPRPQPRVPSSARRGSHAATDGLPPPARLQGMRLVAWVLLCMALTLYLTVSALLLGRLGIHYDLPGGSPLVKFHPGTWVLMLATVVALAAHGNPLMVLVAQWRRRPALAVYMGCIAFISFWSLWRNGSSGAAFIVDTLAAPALALLVLDLYPRRHQRALVRWVLLLLTLNSCIALVEFATKSRLITLGSGERLMLADSVYFRASAMLGHPLVNSMLTLALYPAVWLLREWGVWRWPVIGLMGLSLLAYGGRSALAMATVVYGGAMLATLSWQAVHGRFTYRQLLGGLLALLLGSTALIGVVWISGLGARIFSNLSWDNSADVRRVVWHALDFLHDFDWWVGVSPARMQQIAIQIGLDPRFEAIENFWIELLLQWGLIGFVPFVIGLACLLGATWRHAAAPMRLALPVFLLVASGANTLSSKTVTLTLLVVVAWASAAWRVRRVA